MTLTIIVGVAGFLLLVVAATGVVVDKEGKPSILVTSKTLRSVLGICGLSCIALSVYMWEKELNIQDDLKKKIDTIENELVKTQDNLNKSIGYVYEDSSNYLIRVAKLIGQRSELGCKYPIDKYQKNEDYNPKIDMCNALKLLMHPVTITATNGINRDELSKLIKSLSESEGIPSYITIGDKNTALSEHLAILYPDGVSKKIICIIRNKYENAFKISNPSSKDIALRYALNIEKAREVQRNGLVISSQAIQIGVDIRKYVSGFKRITREEWDNICLPSHSQEAFENFILDKSTELYFKKNNQ